MNKCIRYASKDSLDPLLSHDHNNVEKLNYVLVLEIWLKMCRDIVKKGMRNERTGCQGSLSCL